MRLGGPERSMIVWQRLGRGVRATGKFLAFHTYSAAISPIRTRQLAAKNLQRISILCYHRVDDALKDSVTVPIESFDRQIAYVKRHYQVATLPDLIAGRIERGSRRAIVIVTFDDGYRDNYENAFPILQRYAVQATFFVSTGMIGTERGFRHDLQKLGRALPSMSWDELREMRAAGHEVGGHTVNHVNLARIDEPEALHELTHSRDTVRRELGITDVPFAYCYGGRHDITPARRELVRKLGYTSCLACYGGTNDGPIDLFDVKRLGVNWAVGTAAFRARIEGWA
jgi:peptidoglycan/xylan/chitin deacetylase (PgdA/CDA1 family)